MTQSVVPAAVDDFLSSTTPSSWVDSALSNIELLLIDHANCELKAAATAMSLIFRYPDRKQLVDKMSRLAREELRHFEQVRSLIEKREISPRTLGASRYASGLRTCVANTEPQALVDTLIVGALIEARSCERFALLSPRLDDELSRFYRGLLAAESRHFENYLELARRYHDGPATDFDTRVDGFRDREAALCCDRDTEFRFHSGPVSGQPAIAGEL